MTKWKFTEEDTLWYLRLLRREKGLKNREGKHYLKELRRERGLTQAKLAGKAGVSQQFISRIESNWVNAGPKAIRRLAPALDMDPLELTLLEMIYRRTLAMEYRHSGEPIEELDVDAWTLEEGVDRANWLFGYYEDEDEGCAGISSEDEADQANAALKRLQKRYRPRY